MVLTSKFARDEQSNCRRGLSVSISGRNVAVLENAGPWLSLAVLVEELLILLAQELRFPVDKIRPGDRFSVELAPRRGDEWDSGYGILLYEMKSMARRRRKTITQRIETVDDYLKKMADIY